MTSPSKSKSQSLWATFVVGGFVWVGSAGHGLTQEGTEASVFDTGFRGTITESGDENPIPDATSAADQGRGEVTTQSVANTANVPIPLSQRRQQRATRVEPQPRVFNPASADQRVQQNIAAEPIQRGETPVVEDDPFAATGFRLGIFDANVSLEQSVGYSSNISRNVGGNSGGFSLTEVNAGLVSNWSRHELRLNFDGSYRKPFANEEIDQPEISGETALRLDLVDGMTLTTRGFYNAQTQTFTSTTLAPGAVDTPLRHNFGGDVELQRADRKLQFTIRGRIGREIYEDADLGTGVTASQADLNNTEYGLGLRVGYEISPAIVPFVEGEYALRDFDEAVDRNGNRRDSQITELRGGLAVDLGEKLRGEISVGIVSEQFEDPALADLNGYSVQGELNWSPERDTEIALTLGTETNSSIVAGQSGTFVYTLGVTAERQITDRWAVNGSMNFQRETNDANNTTFQAGFGIEYWVNRFMALTGDVGYESFTSEAAGSDFDEISVRAGVRLQR